MIFNRKFQALLSTSKSVISATSRSKSTVTLIPGDGIGPEIATAVERFIILFIISGMSRILIFCMVFFSKGYLRPQKLLLPGSGLMLRQSDIQMALWGFQKLL